MSMTSDEQIIDHSVQHDAEKTPISPNATPAVSDNENRGSDIEKSQPAVTTEPNGATADAPSADTVAPIPPPDTGRAWLAMIGASFGLYSSFGYINVVGLYEAYYLHHQLSHYSASTISWITSLQIFILFVGGIFFGRIAEMYGPQKLAAFGTVFTITGIMTTSVCKEYWHFLLAQGICTSIGNSAIYYASLLAATTWFQKKRALALGVVVAGSSLGGTTMPFIFTKLQPRIGFPQTVRAIGYLMIGVCVICTLLVSSRFPPNKKLRKEFFNLREEVLVPYTKPSIILVTLAMFFSFWGLFTAIGYMSTHAIAHGMSEETAYYLVSIYNGSSLIGRILPGFVADKFGSYNMHSICTVICGVFLLAMWIPAKTNPVIIAFSSCFGVISGATVSLFPALVASITPPTEVGRRMGVVSFFYSFSSLTAMPIAGQILHSDNDNFTGLQVWAGVTMLVGGFCVFASKMCIEGKTWRSKF
ncbi:major facilitator superfamily domain-containing protein [Yarrowia lipolytica]|jgi:MFS family permease|uniref:YALI0C00825p n=2 Tax=Yarrowia lipolytica TaxID=4952 RepID=Q6CDG0_YARLI|nr:YALI0C00825p [Yarrowia lipolytica CLIB122]AOW02163.1 hypothetical protein YALI1_C01106g [Yarrowia lipolytica]KAB8281022.1 major facilitator superfamily domain-containing protein [Yarrowia lipolytica]KAE8170269.1 major facilitator superfamily domain-containing protein [Yarrowia lipolytica]KAJ8052921.1 major facilitator superfamily domain-containing protein [Yarrowia lipolytica]RDW35063.1 major facilitator superfamily domain-containing protein [Yarrowia lipolytica]|eukprot:XP_501302.1 YALI0C00825p [Yarrowia lipolytica CLIB122]